MPLSGALSRQPHCGHRLRATGQGDAMNVHLLCICAASALMISHETPDPRLRTSSQHGTLSLTISVTGFRSEKGQAIVALYTSKESWLKSDRALRSRTLKIAG